MSVSSDRLRSWCGTQVPCKISATLTSLDPYQPVSDTCLVILVSQQRCAARFDHTLKVGTAVQLSGLPTTSSAKAEVTNCMYIAGERFWLLDLALSEPGDVWGIRSSCEE